MPRRLLAAVCALALVPVFAACGDDAGAGTVPTNTAVGGGQQSGTNSTAVPKLSSPASQYTLSIEDLGTNWITDIPSTFNLDASAYGKTPIFPSAADGKKMLEGWGYIEGYETAYKPELGDTSVLNGAGYYISTETHLFKEPAGAAQAYDYFIQFIGSIKGTQSVTVKSLGNKSAAYTTTTGKIGSSNVNAVYHHIVTLRGNVITVVLTKGAEGFMKVDTAWQLAAIADAKELGERKTIVPTPTSNYQTPVPSAKP